MCWVRKPGPRIGPTLPSFANGSSSFYVNGLAVGTSNATVPSRNSVHVGVKPGGGFTLPGGSGIDELRFFTFDAGDDPVSFLNLPVIPEPSALGLFVLGGVLLRCRQKANRAQN